MGTWNKLEKVKCSVEDCEDMIKCSTGFCKKHHLRFTRYGRTHSIVNRGSGYTIHPKGYIYITVDGKPIAEHTYLAEKALGKKLPKGAQIHHTGARDDNHGYCKLVVCPDRAYHALIHKRMKDLGYEVNQD